MADIVMISLSEEEMMPQKKLLGLHSRGHPVYLWWERAWKEIPHCNFKHSYDNLIIGTRYFIFRT